MTIFLGEHNQSMTIGDISVKNSADGLGGIQWIEVEQHEKYGKLPATKEIWVATADS